MNNRFKGDLIVLAGGDKREIELHKIWKDAGAAVKLFGFEKSPHLAEQDRAGAEDLSKAATVIFPLSGIGRSGEVTSRFAAEKLIAPALLKYVRQGALLLAGSADPSLAEEINRRWRLLLTADDNELALLNAIPTAEGAIQKAMEFSDITIHGSRALVLGLGRCGIALSRALQGLGARVTVAVRRRESEALATTLTLEAVYIEDLLAAVGKADFIFNTVPALLLDRTLLERTGKEALILDLASAPGGTDFEAARELASKAYLLPALPGQVAPRTAARVLFKVYRRLIRESGSMKISGEEEPCHC